MKKKHKILKSQLPSTVVVSVQCIASTCLSMKYPCLFTVILLLQSNCSPSKAKWSESLRIDSYWNSFWIFVPNSSSLCPPLLCRRFNNTTISFFYSLFKINKYDPLNTSTSIIPNSCSCLK